MEGRCKTHYFTHEEAEQLIQLIRLIDEFFDGDADKTAIWLTVQNPHLGEAVPLDLFLRGRGHKVLAFARNAIRENEI